MAVIREQRQFKIGTIGVARASEGGRIVGQAISQSANQFADMFYREGLQVAEKAGTEAAQSVERERVMTINPQTGQPEAYTPPAPFGRVAAEAYQRVVQRRFQESMDEEMRIKSAELSARYEDNPNGAALYETAMADYIAAMSENAEGQFGGYIADVGASYLNLTRSNMAINQMRRERAAAAEAQRLAALRANDNYENFVAEFGPRALEEGTLTNSMRSSSVETIQDGIDSALMGPTAITENNRELNIRAARGLVKYAINNISNSADAALIMSAIGTQNPNALPEGYEYIADAMRNLGSDRDALNQLEQYADGLIPDRLQALGIYEQQEQARLDRIAAETVFDLQIETAAERAVTESIASNEQIDPASIVNGAINHVTRLQSLAREAAINGQTDLSNAYLNQATEVQNGYTQGLYRRLLNGLTATETEALEEAIQNRTLTNAPANATNTTASILSELFRLERNPNTNYDIDGELLPIIGSYRDSAGKFVEAQQQFEAYTEFETEITPAINLITDYRGEVISEAVTGLLDRIDRTENLEDSVATAARNEINYRGGQAIITEFFESNPSTVAIASAQSILNGGAITDGLTQEQVDTLRRGYEYINESGRSANANTYFNLQNNILQTRIAENDRINEKNANLRRILLENGGVADSANDRALVDEHFNSFFQEQLQSMGVGDMAGFWSNPEVLASPEAQPILQAVNQLNVMPESLYNSLRGLAQGRFGQNASTLMSHFINYRDYTYNGIVMNNPMMQAFTQEELGTLNLMADAAPIIGTSNVSYAELFSNINRIKSEPDYEDRVNSFYGGDIHKYVRELDGANNLSTSGRRGMTAIAMNAYALAQSDPLNMSLASVTDMLERQIDRSFPNGSGIVLNPDGSRRTHSPLSVAAPNNEDLFKEYTIERLTNAGIEGPILGVPDDSFFSRITAIGRMFPQMGAVSQGNEAEGRFYLQPVGVSANGVTRYQVMQVVSMADGGRRPVMEEVTERDENGNEVTFRTEMIISNQDLRFKTMLSNRAVLENTIEFMEAQRREATRDRIMSPRGGR